VSHGRAQLKRAVRLPALIFALFRERRRVEEGRLRLERADATLRSEYHGIWRRAVARVATPKGILLCVGLGLGAGILGRLPGQGRAGLLRSAAALVPLIASLRRHGSRVAHERVDSGLP
jgi:hypothetical protein